MNIGRTEASTFYPVCWQCNYSQLDAIEGALKTLKHCTRCHRAYYCDENCQKGHWQTHKKFCNPSNFSPDRLKKAEEISKLCHGEERAALQRSHGRGGFLYLNEDRPQSSAFIDGRKFWDEKEDLAKKIPRDVLLEVGTECISQFHDFSKTICILYEHKNRTEVFLVTSKQYRQFYENSSYLPIEQVDYRLTCIKAQILDENLSFFEQVYKT